MCVEKNTKEKIPFVDGETPSMLHLVTGESFNGCFYWAVCKTWAIPFRQLKFTGGARGLPFYACSACFTPSSLIGYLEEMGYAVEDVERYIHML